MRNSDFVGMLTQEKGYVKNDQKLLFGVVGGDGR